MHSKEAYDYSNRILQFQQRKRKLRFAIKKKDNKIIFFIILPNVPKRTLKKHRVTVKESSNFNKGNVNYDL